MPDVSQYAIQINQSEVQFDSISGGDLPPAPLSPATPSPDRESEKGRARERVRE